MMSLKQYDSWPIKQFPLKLCFLLIYLILKPDRWWTLIDFKYSKILNSDVCVICELKVENGQNSMTLDMSGHHYTYGVLAHVFVLANADTRHVKTSLYIRCASICICIGQRWHSTCQDIIIHTVCLHMYMYLYWPTLTLDMSRHHYTYGVLAYVFVLTNADTRHVRTSLYIRCACICICIGQRWHSTCQDIIIHTVCLHMYLYWPTLTLDMSGHHYTYGVLAHVHVFVLTNADTRHVKTSLYIRCACICICIDQRWHSTCQDIIIHTVCLHMYLYWPTLTLDMSGHHYTYGVLAHVHVFVLTNADTRHVKTSLYIRCACICICIGQRWHSTCQDIIIHTVC